MQIIIQIIIQEKLSLKSKVMKKNDHSVRI
jgi:hypothetical protein